MLRLGLKTPLAVLRGLVDVAEGLGADVESLEWSKALQAIRPARSEVRSRAWSLAGENAPDTDGRVVVDLASVFVNARSDKEDAGTT
ncbi:hypothetical protein QFZ22_005579 [Streptomyces canus]|uniref:Uncharacterized protein n=1 Tax=Streptomyces canus TaxID=58343 RepID=A0AAW8FIH9_9ACTN|nr:hypothetical protein [Streptomyces canus]